MTNPLLPLADLIPQARDIGLHLIVARSAGGAGRALFDPVIQRIREIGSPGLIMSGSKDEGSLLGSVRPQAQPPGRGFFVERRTGSQLIQTALLDDGLGPVSDGVPHVPRHRARPAEPTTATATRHRRGRGYPPVPPASGAVGPGRSPARRWPRAGPRRAIRWR